MSRLTEEVREKKGYVLPVACGLVGACAGAADGGVEEAGDGEGVVADGFGFVAEGGLAGDEAIFGVALE